MASKEASVVPIRSKDCSTGKGMKGMKGTSVKTAKAPMYGGKAAPKPKGASA